MCKRAILIGIGVVAAAGVGLAQVSDGAEPLAFETASVRVHQGERVPGGYTASDDTPGNYDVRGQHGLLHSAGLRVELGQSV